MGLETESDATVPVRTEMAVPCCGICTTPDNLEIRAKSLELEEKELELAYRYRRLNDTQRLSRLIQEGKQKLDYREKKLAMDAQQREMDNSVDGWGLTDTGRLKIECVVVSFGLLILCRLLFSE
jgi:hypothetical protein